MCYGIDIILFVVHLELNKRLLTACKWDASELEHFLQGTQTVDAQQSISDPTTKEFCFLFVCFEDNGLLKMT